jgi:addiction module RelE/StbE family toxin
MRIRFSPRARTDLRRIAHRIAVDNPEAARRWVHKLEERARLAGRSPRLGRKVPEVDREDIREAIVGNYRIVYVVQAKTVDILTIFEGHRLLPDLDIE